MLVRQQIAGLTERAERLDRDAQSLDAERDVLARERDALKAALTKASRRSGYAVLPYKGPNGTWQRPIVLECTAGGVKLQLQGRTFTALELSPLIHPRSSPFVRAIAQELLHIRSADTPDGAPAVPYLVFLVRPDGIRAYYEARTCLEPLGIAFGYELIEQDLVVDIPNFDDLTTWDGSIPLEMPLEPAPRPKSNVAMRSSAERGWERFSKSKSEIRNPKGRPGRGEIRGQRAVGRNDRLVAEDRPARVPPIRTIAVPKISSGRAAAGTRRTMILRVQASRISTGTAIKPRESGPDSLLRCRAVVGPASRLVPRRPDLPSINSLHPENHLDVAGSSTSSIGTGSTAGNGSGSGPFLQGNGSLPGLARDHWEPGRVQAGPAG